jgi:DNA-binding transcriptional ArsR family regulator
MKDGPDIVRIAALIGDPARANILTALMAGQALTATELAAEAGVTAQTASSHLGKLEAGGLIRPRKQGRHKYFALADAGVARVLEALMGLAESGGHRRSRTGPKDADLRAARVCYNHLAGEAGTRLFDSLVGRGFLQLAPDGLTLSEAGRGFVADLGLGPDRLAGRRAPLCRECLDWSERRSHLAGVLGRALFERFQELGWCERVPGTRVVRFRGDGRRAFDRAFPVDGRAAMRGTAWPG